MTKDSPFMTVYDNCVTIIKNFRKCNSMSKLQSQNQKRNDNFKRMVAFHGVLFIGFSVILFLLAVVLMALSHTSTDTLQLVSAVWLMAISCLTIILSAALRIGN